MESISGQGSVRFVTNDNRKRVYSNRIHSLHVQTLGAHTCNCSTWTATSWNAQIDWSEETRARSVCCARHLSRRLRPPRQSGCKWSGLNELKINLHQTKQRPKGRPPDSIVGRSIGRSIGRPTTGHRRRRVRPSTLRWRGIMMNGPQFGQPTNWPARVCSARVELVLLAGQLACRLAG